VRDGVAVQETLGGANDLGALGGGLANHRLDATIVGLLIAADPLEHDAGDAKGRSRHSSFLPLRDFRLSRRALGANDPSEYPEPSQQAPAPHRSSPNVPR